MNSTSSTILIVCAVSFNILGMIYWISMSIYDKIYYHIQYKDKITLPDKEFEKVLKDEYDSGYEDGQNQLKDDLFNFLAGEDNVKTESD